MFSKWLAIIIKPAYCVNCTKDIVCQRLGQFHNPDLLQTVCVRKDFSDMDQPITLSSRILRIPSDGGKWNSVTLSDWQS